jgi:glutathione S-transferase
MKYRIARKDDEFGIEVQYRFLWFTYWQALGWVTPWAEVLHPYVFKTEAEAEAKVVEMRAEEERLNKKQKAPKIVVKEL